MKKVLFFLLALICLCSVAFAYDDYEIEPDTQVSELQIIRDKTDLELTDVSIVKAVAPVTPESSSGLKAALLSFIGDYDPVIVEYQYQSSQGYTSYLREVQPDYSWMISAAFLLVLVYCIFRLLGVIFCRK